MTSMNRNLRMLLAVPVALLTVACNGDDRVDTVATTDTTMMGAPAGTTPAAGTGTMMGAGMGSTIAMQPVGGSGVSGEATLTESGQQTQVMVRLMGSTANATHQGHIHSGTCASPGAVVVPLQSISVDAQGSGTSTSTVDVPIHTAANGQHIVVYHEAGGSPGAPVVCGEIPGHTM
jgi:hypothetical protein